MSENPDNTPEPPVAPAISSNWPTPEEMGDLMNCVFCNCTPTYPVMQCQEGHLICESEGRQFKFCPGPKVDGDVGERCGAQLIGIRLRWFKWMTQHAFYACPVPDCLGSLVGQGDRRGHMAAMHPEESKMMEKKDGPHKPFVLMRPAEFEKFHGPAASLRDVEVESSSPSSLVDEPGVDNLEEVNMSKVNQNSSLLAQAIYRELGNMGISPNGE